tara:strand:- start:129294 stop:130427 length:1134 start_codon:yes stop_codon:yes gene_type:complete
MYNNNATVTVLCHGTGSDQENGYLKVRSLDKSHDELITLLGNHIVDGIDLGRYYNDPYYLYELSLPPSQRQPKDNYKYANVETRGSEIIDSHYKIVLNGPGATNRPPCKMNPQQLTASAESLAQTSRTKALLTGKGWENNVAYTCQLLQQHFSPTAGTGQTLKTINLVGWSRGAVTCNMIANAIVKCFPQVTINIFSVDPVVGGLTTTTQAMVTLPHQVNFSQIILASHAQLPGFKPLYPQIMRFNPMTTKLAVDQFPGTHSTPVVRSKKITSGTTLVATVIFHMAKQFLSDHNSRLTADANQYIPDMSPQELLAYCNHISASRAQDYLHIKRTHATLHSGSEFFTPYHSRIAAMAAAAEEKARIEACTVMPINRRA